MIVEDIPFDYGLTSTIPSSANSQIALNHEYGYDASLFVGYDLGAFRIEAEVAYKRANLNDIYDVGLAGGGETSALNYMINGLLDFGDDDGVSGFVGAGTGVARVDYNNIRAFSNQGAVIDDSDTRFAWQVIAGLKSMTGGRSTQMALEQVYDLNFVVNRTIPFYYTVQVMTTDLVMDNLSKTIGSLSQPEVDTTVIQPKLPDAEVYKSNSPKVATDGKQEPSNPQQCSPGINFWNAEKMYEAAKKQGDVGGMQAAKGLMQAAIGRQWQTMEHVTEAGEMTSMSGGARYSLGDFLGKMMDSYKAVTGELPPGYYDSPNGYTTDIVPPDPNAPALPAAEVYNPADAPKCTLDVM
jgi:hypothetical protein